MAPKGSGSGAKGKAPAKGGTPVTFKPRDILTIGVASGSEDDLDEAGPSGTTSSGGGGGETADWREEMREEIRIAVREAMMSSALSVSDRPAVGNASIVDPADVITASELSSVVKKMEANNRSNKYAIRLAAISKEGNKQQFLDMVELRESVEKAEAAIKGEELDWTDIAAARDALEESLGKIDARMAMIERIDAHPLSWPVATEYQRMKRARPCDKEEEKLFQEAEKKVAADRKKREEATSSASGKSVSMRTNDKFHFSRRNGE